MKNAKPKKGGRPSSFRPEFMEQAEEMALLGLTTEQMAKVLGVAKSTFDLWLKKNKKFSDTVKRGKEAADAKVAAALFHRACGYSHKATKIMQYEGVPIEVEYIQHYPPDTAAAFIWLKNRQPALWRDKNDDPTGNAPPPASVPVTVEDASAGDADAE